MSTRCRIGITNQDGTISSIYCHHDGYISGGVGETLVEHYITEDKIRKLLNLGDISRLGNEPVDNPNAWKRVDSIEDYFTKYAELHPDDMCDTYKSRGEECPLQISKNASEYHKTSRECCGDYTYLFKNNEWYVRPYDTKRFIKVKSKRFKRFKVFV